MAFLFFSSLLVFICTLIQLSLVANYSFSSPIVADLTEETTFRIKESADYALWGSYRRINPSQRKPSKHFRGPFPLKETFYGIDPVITRVKTNKQVTLLPGNQITADIQRHYDSPYIIGNDEDYFMYLEKGLYRFEKCYTPNKEKPLLTHSVEASIETDKFSETVIYSICKTTPIYIKLIKKLGVPVCVISFLIAGLSLLGLAFF